MSKVKIYKCRTCDHFHCDNPEKHTFSINGSEFMLYREHRSSIRLVHEEVKQRLKSQQAGERRPTDPSPPRNQIGEVIRISRQSQEQPGIPGADSYSRVKPALENTAQATGQSPSRLQMQAETLDQPGSNRSSRSNLNRESMRSLTNYNQPPLDLAPTAAFTFPQTASEISVPNKLPPSYPQTPLSEVGPKPKIFISEDIEYRAGGTPTKSPVFGETHTIPTDRPSIPAHPSSQFSTSEVERRRLQEPSRYELKPTFNEYSEAPYVASSSFQVSKPVYKPSGGQSFHSTNVTSNITYEPIQMKSVLPQMSFVNEGRLDDSSRYLTSRIGGMGGTTGTNLSTDFRPNDPFKSSMGSVYSSTGMYQPRSDLYQIIDSPAKPLAPTIPHYSAFKTEAFRSTSTTSQFNTNFGSNFGLGTGSNYGTGSGSNYGLGTGSSFGGFTRDSSGMQSNLFPPSSSFQPINITQPFNNYNPTNTYQPSMSIHSPPPTSIHFPHINSTAVTSPSLTRISSDYNINVKVIPPSISDPRHESPTGREPRSVYDYSPPISGYPMSGGFAGSPAFATHIQTSPSTIERPEAKGGQHPAGTVTPVDLSLSRTKPGPQQGIGLQQGTTSSQRSSEPPREPSQSQVHSQSNLQQQSQSSSGKPPGDQQLRELLQGNIASSQASELAGFTGRNNQYSGSNNEQSEDQLKRNWVGKDPHSISVSGIKRLANNSEDTGQYGVGSQDRIAVSRQRGEVGKERRPYSSHRPLRLIPRVKDCTLEDNRCLGLSCMTPLLNPLQYEIQLDERGHRTRSIYK